MRRPGIAWPVTTTVFAALAFTSAPGTAAASGTAGVAKTTGVAGLTELVSVRADGGSTHGPSEYPDISADGAWISFGSNAGALVEGEHIDGQMQVYRWSEATGAMTLVSRDLDGGAGNDRSDTSMISDNGRYVAFESLATDLVEGDADDSFEGIYLRDLRDETTTLLSRGIDGATVDRRSDILDMSGDGRFVVFCSSARNLVPGADNGAYDIFVADRMTGAITLVSATEDGLQASDDSFLATISGDGRFVAFESNANDIVADDTNRYSDVFVRDMTTGETTLISRALDGSVAQGFNTQPGISRDGAFVAFTSNAKTLVADHTGKSHDVYLRELATGDTTLVSRTVDGDIPRGISYFATVADGGTAVAFASTARNLVTGDRGDQQDVFVVDMATGTTSWVSRRDAQKPGQSDSNDPKITADGLTVAFSDYDQVTSVDHNNDNDVYRWSGP